MQPSYNMDKLFEAAQNRGCVCVGLDTAPDYIPPAERARAPTDADALWAFNRAIIDAVLDAAACFKVQIAYYEALGLAGLAAYAKTLAYIRAQGALVIADIKRGDIADTAQRYAAAHFSGDFEADFVTLSPYMGMDSIEPWLDCAARQGKGAFVLMRTSNPGMRDFEYLELAGGGSPPHAPNAQSAFSAAPPAGAPPPQRPRRGAQAPRTPHSPGPPPYTRRLYHAVGDKLAELAAAHQGIHGYGAFGAVAGCTEPEEAAELRARYPRLFFLIPGYGTQGGAAADAALLLQQGQGGVVNASRSILKAWTRAATPDADNAFAAAEARRAVIEMRDAISAAVKAGAGQ